MQRLKDERGVATIFVALTAVAVFAMGAVVVDVGSLLQEKRVLQNGADASALAIAEQCGAGDCADPNATASDYSNANADDGASTIEDLCGDGVDGVSACDDPPDVPEGAHYVKVSTSTESADGGSILPYSFARLIGFDGGTVHTRAIAAWGGPSSLTSGLPMTISACEFEHYTNGGADLDAPPPYDTSGYPTPEAIIYLHNTHDTLAPPFV
jgi:hypothetical protein